MGNVFRLWRLLLHLPSLRAGFFLDAIANQTVRSFNLFQDCIHTFCVKESVSNKTGNQKWITPELEGGASAESDCVASGKKKRREAAGQRNQLARAVRR